MAFQKILPRLEHGWRRRRLEATHRRRICWPRLEAGTAKSAADADVSRGLRSAPVTSASFRNRFPKPVAGTRVVIVAENIREECLGRGDSRRFREESGTTSVG